MKKKKKMTAHPWKRSVSKIPIKLVRSTGLRQRETLFCKFNIPIGRCFEIFTYTYPASGFASILSGQTYRQRCARVRSSHRRAGRKVFSAARGPPRREVTDLIGDHEPLPKVIATLGYFVTHLGILHEEPCLYTTNGRAQHVS